MEHRCLGCTAEYMRMEHDVRSRRCRVPDCTQTDLHCTLHMKLLYEVAERAIHMPAAAASRLAKHTTPRAVFCIGLLTEKHISCEKRPERDQWGEGSFGAGDVEDVVVTEAAIEIFLLLLRLRGRRPLLCLAHCAWPCAWPRLPVRSRRPPPPLCCAATLGSVRVQSPGFVCCDASSNAPSAIPQSLYPRFRSPLNSLRW